MMELTALIFLLNKITISSTSSLHSGISFLINNNNEFTCNFIKPVFSFSSNLSFFNISLSNSVISCNFPTIKSRLSPLNFNIFSVSFILIFESDQLPFEEIKLKNVSNCVFK